MTSSIRSTDTSASPNASREDEAGVSWPTTVPLIGGSADRTGPWLGQLSPAKDRTRLRHACTETGVNVPQPSGHSCCLLSVVGEVLFVLDGRSVLECAVEPVGVVPDEPLEHRG